MKNLEVFTPGRRAFTAYVLFMRRSADAWDRLAPYWRERWELGAAAARVAHDRAYVDGDEDRQGAAARELGRYVLGVPIAVSDAWREAADAAVYF